jgi:nucleoside 2-deoxyribosyltransferase
MSHPVFQAEFCPLTKIEKPFLKVFEPGIKEDYGNKGYQWYFPEIPEKLLIVESDLYYDAEFWDKYDREIFYILFNDLWPKKLTLVDKPLLQALIKSSGIPCTPTEKISELLLMILSKSNIFGDKVFFNVESNDHTCWKLGIINSEELKALITESEELGFLKIHVNISVSISVSLTSKGYENALVLGQSKESKSVFVAMSFDSEMIQIYNDWIEPAIRESEFQPYIVFNEHTDSDVTINDAFLAGIKKAKFTIADFTNHKAGVYFEAGYALGRGHKVIYTCHEKQIKKAHFDTRNYQHIVWKDGPDLKQKLMDKIEVFIKA